MAEEMDAEDVYRVLGLERGCEKGAVKKAYRKLALRYHPDKNPGDAEAEAMFLKVYQASQILLDDEKRKEFDNKWRVQKARSEKRQQEDGKIKRMREELERKERQAKKAKVDMTALKRNLRAEVERLREEYLKKPNPTAVAANNGAATGGSTTDQASRGGGTLRLKWRLKKATFSADGIRDMFSGYGVVEDVLLKSGDKSGSAIVSFREYADATRASTHQVPNLTIALVGGPSPSPAPAATTTPASKDSTPPPAAAATDATANTSIFPEPASASVTMGGSAASFSSFPGASFGSAPSIGSSSYEDVILGNMKKLQQQKEREELMKRIMEEEAAEEGK